MRTKTCLDGARYGGLNNGMKPLVTAFFIGAALPALAQCPDVADRSDDLQAIYQQAQNATSETAARPLRMALWNIWAEAPDAYAQNLLDTGMERRNVADYLGARQAFDALVDYCPDYAEGYNQRAFVAFLTRDYEAAIADLDRALERSPLHVAAMTGKAHSLVRLGRDFEARRVLEAALALNPWLPERGLLLSIGGEDL